MAEDLEGRAPGTPLAKEFTALPGEVKEEPESPEVSVVAVGEASPATPVAECDLAGASPSPVASPRPAGARPSPVVAFRLDEQISVVCVCVPCALFTLCGCVTP